MHVSISEDSANHELCSTVVFTIDKKAAYKRTYTVQTHVVQESAVLHALPCPSSLSEINNYSEMYAFPSLLFQHVVLTYTYKLKFMVSLYIFIFRCVAVVT